VGTRTVRRRDEFVARDAAHRIEHAQVCHTARRDGVDHAKPLVGSVVRSNCADRRSGRCIGSTANNDQEHDHADDDHAPG
jgi:hypothetical protein